MHQSGLRRKIEPDPAQPRLIVTVPGVGYRFAAHPEPTSTPDNIESSPSPLRQSASTVPEIRQVTVLHCLVSGPALKAAYRDPEDLHRLLTEFLAYSDESTRQAGGTMAPLFSNAFQVCFENLPAHENAVERAIYAAFGWIEAAGKVETAGTGVLQARIGIASAPTIVGDLLGSRARKAAALGGAANLAALLAAVAEPNTVLLSDPTPHSICELFEVCEHTPAAFGGWVETIPAWQVIGPRPATAGADPKLWPTRPETNCDLSHTPGAKL